ncbi:BppU family phage baseplate upper protein [Fructobacillus fructosus]|uniref:BppU family phage baseplate upper protein n=1 Tax=Fructobacillus fructosus TaxID=1631 RepID=UPI004033A15B
MMSKAINLALDTTKSDINNPTYKLRRGDGNYQTIRATITANGEPFDLTDVSVSFNGTTAANTKVIDYNVVKIDILQGVIEYTPNKQMGSSVGRYKEAYFRFTKGDSTATTASFNIDVTTSVDINNEDAKDYISIVDTVVKNLNDTTEKQLAHSDEVINGHIDELSEKIESTTQDFNEKANKATSSILEAQREIDSKLTDTKQQIDRDFSNTNDRVKQLNDALDSIKADEPNYAKLNSDNTFKGKNTFEQKIIAPNGLQGNADTAGKSDEATHATNADLASQLVPTNDQTVNNLIVNGFHHVMGDSIFEKLDANGPLFAHSDIIGFSAVTSTKFRDAWVWDNGLNAHIWRNGNVVMMRIQGGVLSDHYAFSKLEWNIPVGFRPFDEAHVLASVGYTKGIIKIYPDGSAWNVDQTFKPSDNNGGDGVPFGFGVWLTNDGFPA